MLNSVIPWTVARQAPLSIGFSRQVFCRRLPFPLPGNLPNPGIKPMSPMSPALPGGFFTTGPLGNQVHHEGGDIDLMTANTVKLRPEYSYEVSMEVHGFHTIRFMPYRFYFDDVTCTVRLVGQEDLVAVGGLHRHLSPKYWFRSKINPFARML